jgi:hypothetical protein
MQSLFALVLYAKVDVQRFSDIPSEVLGFLVSHLSLY